MKRAGGFASIAAALVTQGVGARQADVALYGASRPPTLSQRDSVVIAGGSEFRLYEVKVGKLTAVDQASKQSTQTRTGITPDPAYDPSSTDVVLPMMAAAFADLARPQPSTPRQVVVACGEPISITPLRTPNLGSIHTARQIFYPVVREAECRYGLPTGLLDAVVIAESRYNPMAISSKGAGGLSQLMPGTATGLGVTNRFDPRANIDGGARYLRQLLDRFGSVPVALAAYNAGPGSVVKAKGIPQNAETSTYVRNVLTYWRGTTEAFQNPLGEAHRMAAMFGFITN